ncbi:MAG TPA: hypothetical protein VFW35_12980 [Sphingomicrobium sp.]|nr:hypothetical protein [Sphingomicrobium sp.]
MNKQIRNSGIGILIAGTALGGVLFALRPAHAQLMQFGSKVYHANLTQLNNSHASGSADLILSGDQRTLLVHIVARGLERGGPHLSHIHGLSSNGRPVNSTCPTTAQDTDHDGFVELAEGQATYGPILVDFMNVDPNEDGVVDFRTVVRNPGGTGALPLDDRHIVIHGMTVGAVGAGTPGEVNGTAGYKTVLPVLCGELQRTR